MPGNTPTGLLPTGPGAPGTEVSTATGPAAHGRRATAPRLSVVSRGLSEPSPAGAQGTAPRARGKPAAQRRNRTWFRVISPLAILAGWQLVSMSGLISQQKLPPPSTVLRWNRPSCLPRWPRRPATSG